MPTFPAVLAAAGPILEQSLCPGVLWVSYPTHNTSVARSWLVVTAGLVDVWCRAQAVSVLLGQPLSPAVTRLNLQGVHATLHLEETQGAPVAAPTVADL